MVTFVNDNKVKKSRGELMKNISICIITRHALIECQIDFISLIRLVILSPKCLKSFLRVWSIKEFLSAKKKFEVFTQSQISSIWTEPISVKYKKDLTQSRGNRIVKLGRLFFVSSLKENYYFRQ
jgi:hypothetical protein